jgi:hypothetical protein
MELTLSGQCENRFLLAAHLQPLCSKCRPVAMHRIIVTMRRTERDGGSIKGGCISEHAEGRAYGIDWPGLGEQIDCHTYLEASLSARW